MKHSKANLIVGALLAAASIVPAVSHAADGTITFTGKVLAQSCKVNTGKGDLTVALPSAVAGSLATAGQRAGRVPFTLSLTECDDQAGKVSALFVPGALDANSGKLKNNLTGKDAATNVGIALLNSDGKDMNLAAVTPADQGSSAATVSGKKAELKYFAEYAALGAATPGAVTSTATYTIQYL
ncbi:fimbrial protein [Pseudoduganella sp. R-43]|uniref:fimbrial protein n=1 Tax=unclassified Pseudoduganella TaxID=2637179 RepID=UPI003CF67F49